MDLYTYLGFTQTSLETVAQDTSRYYITYRIRKRNGKARRIDAPQDPLKLVQSTILHKILYLFTAHPIAFGFVRAKSPLTNAQMHVGKKYIVSIDLKNFFNSISMPTVISCLQWLFKLQNKFTYTSSDIETIARLMCYKGVLPQGAPTSPVMSNLICLSLDKKLSSFASGIDATITRYADDIVLSSNDKSIFKSYMTMVNLVRRMGLRVNDKKTKFRSYYQRQQVTGIVVNTQTGVPKEKWRNLRARIHNVIRDGKSITSLEHQQIRGYIEWIKNLNPTRGEQLLQQLSKVSVV